MSVAKLLLSGLLVASGLILAAFTLHNQFAPKWEAQATGLHARERELLATVQERDGAATADKALGAWTLQLVRAEPEATMDASAASTARKRPGKKLAEKRPKKEEAEQEEPQAMLPWLWNLLANNSK
jgi:hypothetical protein